MKLSYELRMFTEDGNMIDESSDRNELVIAAHELSKFNPEVPYYVVEVQRRIDELIGTKTYPGY